MLYRLSGFAKQMVCMFEHFLAPPYSFNVAHLLHQKKNSNNNNRRLKKELGELRTPVLHNWIKLITISWEKSITNLALVFKLKNLLIFQLDVCVCVCVYFIVARFCLLFWHRIASIAHHQHLLPQHVKGVKL